MAEENRLSSAQHIANTAVMANTMNNLSSTTKDNQVHAEPVFGPSVNDQEAQSKVGDAIVVGGSADHVVANPVAQVPLEIAAAEGLSINERGQVVRHAPPAAAAAAPANNANRWDWKSPHKFRVVAHSFNFINSLLYLVVFIMSLTIIEKDENLQNLTIYT